MKSSKISTRCARSPRLRASLRSRSPYTRFESDKEEIKDVVIQHLVRLVQPGVGNKQTVFLSMTQIIKESLLEEINHLLNAGGEVPDFCLTPYTLQPTPYTLHPTPYTLHSTPFALHPTPYNLHPTPYTLHPTPYILHPQS